nr:LacI family transcriptional regulator [Lachnospiraceae bacterium]
MVTIKQIAESLNMSATTVSNVIHGKTKEVSQETIDRVQKFLDEVEYVPNINARNLAQNQSNIIGIVLKTSEDRYAHILCDPFVSEMLGGIERVVREAGFYMMLYISDDITEIINHIASWNVDGLLLFWMQDEDAVHVYKRFKKPVVYIDTFVNWRAIEKIGKKYINVGLTDHESTYRAVKYLIGKGHRKIGFLSEARGGVNGQRYDGYLQALEESGIGRENGYYFDLKPTKDEIDESLDELAEQAKEVTAIFCCSDNFAAMLMNTCIKKGIRVPEDLSIMGFDDNQNRRLCRPELTTMHQDIEKKG